MLSVDLGSKYRTEQQRETEFGEPGCRTGDYGVVRSQELGARGWEMESGSQLPTLTPCPVPSRDINHPPTNTSCHVPTPIGWCRISVSTSVVILASYWDQAVVRPSKGGSLWVCFRRCRRG